MIVAKAPGDGVTDIAHACRVLREGGIVAYPTEAVYGLGCDPANPDALARLIALKGRDADKGMIVIAADFSQLEPLVGKLPPDTRSLVATAHNPPTTWIVPASERVHSLLSGSRATLAIRVSTHPCVVELCNRFGAAITSTSANPSGEQPARDSTAVRDMFAGRVDAVVDGEIGSLAQPTRIIDALTKKVLR